MTDLSWSAPIEVSSHAATRSRQRLGWTGTDDDVLAERIRGEIRSAIVMGRVARSRPNWTRGNGEVADRTGALFLWDADVTHCWVVYRRHGVLRVASALEEYVRTRGRGERSQRLREGLDYA